MTEKEPTPVKVVVESESVIVSTVPPHRPRKVYAGMWGVPEITAVAISAMAVLAALAVYVFFVVPSNRELAKNQSEAERLEAEVQSAVAKYGEISSTTEQVDKIVVSMDDFETRFLPAVSNGQAALYQRLNGLFGAYGLVNTTGPDYAPLETVEQNDVQATEEEKGRSKFRSIYPGVYVSMTLEGSYHNLRRFIREIETGNEFVVISAVELAPSDTQAEKKEPQQNPESAQNDPSMGPARGGASNPKGMPPGFGGPMPAQPQSRRQPGKSHGEIVSLHLEMAAYFRRPNFAPLTIAPGQ
jgi:Tfp pilus assembly protein PilO